jgi:hypothetical protein
MRIQLKCFFILKLHVVFFFFLMRKLHVVKIQVANTKELTKTF